MRSIDEFWEDMKKNRAECPWSKEQTMQLMVEQLAEETREIREALDKDDAVNLKEELGDLLWDYLFLMTIAEEEFEFTFDDVVKSAQKKMRRRKPWVFGDMQVKDKEEAVRIWNEIKANE